MNDNSEKEYKVGWVAERLEIAVKTLKSWEERQLIPAARRNKFGWRVYTEQEFSELKELIIAKGYFRS